MGCVKKCAQTWGREIGVESVAVSSNNTLKVWDAQSGQETRTLKGHAGPVSSVAFSPDGRRIVSGSEDTTLKVWDASKSAPKPTVEQ